MRWTLALLCFAFIASPSETHTLHSLGTYNNRQAIEACIHSALPHGRRQLRCGLVCFALLCFDSHHDDFPQQHYFKNKSTGSLQSSCRR
jgi:hypothetical protein